MDHPVGRLTLRDEGVERPCGRPHDVAARFIVAWVGESLQMFYYFKNPEFAILNPEFTFSVPRYQMVAGIYDTMSHILEQYLSAPVADGSRRRSQPITCGRGWRRYRQPRPARASASSGAVISLWAVCSPSPAPGRRWTRAPSSPVTPKTASARGKHHCGSVVFQFIGQTVQRLVAEMQPSGIVKGEVS